MGCGASSVQIAPTDNNDNIACNISEKQTNNKENAALAANGCHPKSFKFALFQRQPCSNTSKFMSKNKNEQLIKEIGVQTECDVSDDNTSAQYTQTDFILLPEDELEIMMRSLENGSGSEDESRNENNDHSVQSVDSDVNKSVLLQTEELRLFGRQRVTTKNVTIDVGIQVKPQKTTSATQTRYGSVCNAKVPNNNNNNNKQSKYTKNNNHISDNLERTAINASISSDSSSKMLDFLQNIENLKLNFQDFESQTDPLLSTVLAANCAGNDLNVLQSCDISSPFAHIEKELLKTHNHCKNKVPNLQNCICKLLDDMDDAFGNHKHSSVTKCDASVQTDNDPITDESPEYAARPPPCRKKEMIPSLFMFKEIDKRILEAPVFDTLQELVDYISKYAKNDLFKVRGIFRWITNNIKYDWKYLTVSMTSSEIMSTGEGVCKDYCQLFEDLCRLSGIRVKKIAGFAKGHDYIPGHQFKPGEDITHTWNAVFLLKSWRLVDTTWGTGYTDPTGKFQQKINEHFFLTDPEILIWTHFPYNEIENNYSRWQLLDKPLSLEEFNLLPKVSAHFFDFNLKIRSRSQNPIVFRIFTEVKIGSHEAMRYKYKLYPSDEVENSSLNHYVFCQLKEDRLVGSFACTPPIEGRFYLKIFAKPERDMQEGQDSTSLQNVVTFLLECSRARKYIEPFPLNELPWGPTQTFYDFKLRLHNQKGPVIATWGGKRTLLMEANEVMLITYSLFDAESMEMDARSVIYREDSGAKTTFIINPPRVGTFKFMIFGMPKPKQKGKWRLPLLATFMIDCKLIKAPQYDEDPPAVNFAPIEEPKGSDKRKGRQTSK